MWQWEKNSILYTVTPYVPTRTIFEAVCTEIGRYYQDREITYKKSKKELKWKGNNIWCKFGFWSSRSNKSGEWVNLEIVTSVFALDISEMERKGILVFGIKPKNFNVYQIDYDKFNEIITFIENTLELVKSLDTKEGLESYLLKTSKQAFIEKDPNNLRYLNIFELDS